MKKKIFFCLFAFLTFAALCPAQAIQCQIQGQVFGENDRPAAGVRITALNPAMVGTTITVTDKNGFYRLAGLTPGVFTIQFEYSDSAGRRVENVRVGLGQTIVIDHHLSRPPSDPPFPLAATDMRNPAMWPSWSRESFALLPIGRDFDSIFPYVPGVSNEPRVGGAMVDGASGLENSYFINGADTTNLGDGNRGQRVAFDFVEEVQIQSSGLPASVSGAVGGVFNVITRSGGNEFHGEVLGYYNGSPLTGHKRKILDLDENDPWNSARYYDYSYFYGTDHENRLEAGFNLGGYILKDKLWFFGSFLPVFYSNRRTVTHADGVTKDWKRTEDYWNFQLKVTAQPLDNLRLSAGLVNNFYKYKGDLPTFFSNSSPSPSFDDYGFTFPNFSGSLSADLTLGDSAMISLRGGYFRTDQNNQLIHPTGPCYQFLTEAPSGYLRTSNIGLLDVPVEYQRSAGYSNYSRANAQIYNQAVNMKWSVNGDVQYFLNLGGEHAWQAGVQYIRQGQDYDVTARYPILFLGWNRECIAFGTNYGRGKYGYYAVRGNDVTGPYGNYYQAFSNRWAAYIQDSWSVNRRLTLNIGIRAESEFLPSYATGYPEFEDQKIIEFGFGDKIAPRLGFVYDVRGDASLKIYGSVAWYYDILKLGEAAEKYSGFKWKSAFYTLDTYEWTKIGIDGYYPGTLLKVFDFRSPENDDPVDPGLKPMSQREISLGFEKKLKENLSLSVRLVNKHLIHTIEDVMVVSSDGEHIYTANRGSEFIREKFQESRDIGWLLPNTPDLPKAKREYFGLNISLDKHFSQNWLGGVSYTFSSLRGNTNGLVPLNDKTSTSASSLQTIYPSWYSYFDHDLKPLTGPLPGDRPHYFKTYGSYSFPFGLTAGAVINAMDGVPTSTQWEVFWQPYYPYNLNDLGRTPFLWFANLYLEYTIKLGKNRLNFNLNIDNLFDTRTATRVYSVYNLDGVGVGDAEILAGGWEIDDYEPVLDPRFLMKTDFYATPITVRLGVRYIF